MATIDWTPVEEAEAEKTLTGYKVALVEAAKVLDQRLREERVPGANLLERIQSARWHFTRPDDVERSAAFVESFQSGATGGLTKAKAKDYLQTFRQAVADINDLSQSRDSFRAQTKLYLGLLKGKQGLFLKALLVLGLAFLLILFLADTGPGQVFVTGIVGLVHLFFGLILTLLLIVGLIVVIVIGTAIYLDRRAGGGRIKEEDE